MPLGFPPLEAPVQHHTEDLRSCRDHQVLTNETVSSVILALANQNYLAPALEDARIGDGHFAGLRLHQSHSPPRTILEEGFTHPSPSEPHTVLAVRECSSGNTG